MGRIVKLGLSDEYDARFTFDDSSKLVMMEVKSSDEDNSEFHEIKTDYLGKVLKVSDMPDLIRDSKLLANVIYTNNWYSKKPKSFSEPTYEFKFRYDRDGDPMVVDNNNNGVGGILNSVGTLILSFSSDQARTTFKKYCMDHKIEVKPFLGSDEFAVVDYKDFNVLNIPKDFIITKTHSWYSKKPKSFSEKKSSNPSVLLSIYSTDDIECVDANDNLTEDVLGFTYKDPNDKEPDAIYGDAIMVTNESKHYDNPDMITKWLIKNSGPRTTPYTILTYRVFPIGTPCSMLKSFVEG